MDWPNVHKMVTEVGRTDANEACVCEVSLLSTVVL